MFAWFKLEQNAIWAHTSAGRVYVSFFSPDGAEAEHMQNKHDSFVT